ncbi:hypothetical protein D5F52_16810 [Brevibacillus laterosporus]|nr:hypothetical protein D5F52_16810 [Brevibacillus laterosporus]MBM7109773.1 2-dehydropantoate 2-reductase [Brevibacillus laterosporus]
MPERRSFPQVAGYPVRHLAFIEPSTAAEQMNGFDIALLEIKSEKDIPERVQTLQNFMEPFRLLKASMLQDLEKKRKTEIDYINGVVPRLAEGKGILTPYNDIVVKLVKQAEESQSVPNFASNIKYFEELNK